MVAVAVTCAETDEHASYLAGPSALSFLNLRKGHPSRLPSPQEAAEYPYTDMDRAFITERQSSQLIGSQETVGKGLRELLETTAADELMITTTTYDPADRLRSFELVASLT
jgi:alkanesulfonate monooxygenase SsuD/methylene tetrahydromethanopterin reductase-like flavin-dependent oxidoreductase (luciferase family)